MVSAYQKTVGLINTCKKKRGTGPAWLLIEKMIHNDGQSKKATA